MLVTLTEKQKRRQQLESVVRTGLIAAGQALLAIRDEKLYHETHGEDWDAYCRDTFGLSERRVNQKIAASEVANNIIAAGTNGSGATKAKPKEIEDQSSRAKPLPAGSPGALQQAQAARLSGAVPYPVPTPAVPLNERQVRPLVGLPAEDQRVVFNAATAAEDGKAASAAKIAAAAQKLKEIEAARKQQNLGTSSEGARTAALLEGIKADEAKVAKESAKDELHDAKERTAKLGRKIEKAWRGIEEAAPGLALLKEALATLAKVKRRRGA